MNNLDRLEKLITNDPLFETKPSIEAINPAIAKCEGGSIYFGTGLSTPKKVSQGFPFDLLSMSLGAEKIRRALGLHAIYHHIADTHALSNPFVDEVVLAGLAANAQNTLKLMSDNLGLQSYKVMLSSEFDSSPVYECILDNIKTEENEYVRRELADVEYYRQEKGVCLKIGWIIQAEKTKLKFDERLFDREYLSVVNGDMSFVYLKAGRTLSKTRPKASPYICTDYENRIVLQPDENVAVKLQSKVPSPKVLAHLTDIVHLYEEIIGPVKGSTLAEQIQFIIDKIFGKA